MSLDWDISEVKDFESLDEARTEAMIFATMSVGIGKLTEANARTFYIRLHTLELIHGPIVLASGDRSASTLTTPEQVRAYIGLRTNVSTMSDAAFRGALWTHIRKDAEYIWRKNEESARA